MGDDRLDGNDHWSKVIADLKDQRDRLDAMIASLESIRNLAVPGGIAAPANTLQQTSLTRKFAVEPGPLARMTIADAAKEVLRAENRPLGNAEILTALRDGGLALNSNEPLNTVGSSLNRRFKETGDIVRVGRGTWALKEWVRSEEIGASSSSEGDGDIDDRDLIGGAAPMSASRDPEL